MENDTCFAMYEENNKRGDILVVSKEHCNNFFEMSYKTNEEMFQLARNCKKLLDKRISPDGYNVGFNIGIWAGASECEHSIMHIIPRYAGDIEPEKVRYGIKNITKF